MGFVLMYHCGCSGRADSIFELKSWVTWAVDWAESEHSSLSDVIFKRFNSDRFPHVFVDSKRYETEVLLNNFNTYELYKVYNVTEWDSRLVGFQFFKTVSALL